MILIFAFAISSCRTEPLCPIEPGQTVYVKLGYRDPDRDFHGKAIIAFSDPAVLRVLGPLNHQVLRLRWNRTFWVCEKPKGRKIPDACQIPPDHILAFLNGDPGAVGCRLPEAPSPYFICPGGWEVRTGPLHPSRTIHARNSEEGIHMTLTLVKVKEGP